MNGFLSAEAYVRALSYSRFPDRISEDWREKESDETRETQKDELAVRDRGERRAA